MASGYDPLDDSDDEAVDLYSSECKELNSGMKCDSFAPDVEVSSSASTCSTNNQGQKTEQANVARTNAPTSTTNIPIRAAGVEPPSDSRPTERVLLTPVEIR